METVEYIVKQSDHNTRLDKLVSAMVDDASRTQVQQWIKKGYVKVNDQLKKRNYKCQVDEKIVVHIPEVEPSTIEPEKIPLDIYYEDEDVLVVNKPRGMVVHPAPGHLSGTLVNALMAHCDDLSGINGVMRPGIVHRIDKDTSGLLMVAKNDQAHEGLVNQLVNKEVVRKYRAIVHGEIPHEKGTIDAPIGRDPNDRQEMAVTDKNSKEAITHFQVLKRFTGYTYIECQLETGRTHQIRVHLKYIGYPLVGDPKYGPRKTLPLNGQALHAAVLGFVHPRTGKYLEFEAPEPPEFKKILQELS